MSRRPPAARRPFRVALAAALTLALGGTLGLATAVGASAASVDTNAWYVLVNRQSGKVMDVTGTSTADGAAIQQWPRNDGAWQQWQFVDSGSGWYRLRSRHSGKVLDLWQWSTADRAPFHQYSDLDGYNQQFKLIDSASGAYVRLHNRHSGKLVTVTDRSTADGASITQLTDNNQYNQQWQLVKVGAGTAPTQQPTQQPTTPPPSGGSGSWPSASGQQKVSATIKVSGTLDGRNVRYYGISSGDQDESQPPIFQLSDGAVLRNVIIGTGAGDGVHCTGTCTLENVWWEDVGEDAATLKGSNASQVMTVNGGGARSASDKVFQHNGPGRFVITNFQVSDFGKLYRSCGNCSTQYARTVVIENVQVTAPGKSLVGINSNYGDRATISGVTIVNDPSRKIVICEEYRGVTSGEPSKIGSGPSGACGYSSSSITYR
ncbi:pectate lyase [Cellulomonas sp. zg-ZUI222]|uniref:pectate lyase n=1 Tax=Cellulomonas wangleii TaxID=2816956 RepID=A0ABX8D7X3_9CELL|nr:MULTISPECIES: pectate lyase [Cellulomonas]MBO0900900.1 pectate lyase [Cellulomonas sp. zg-ZUI22]MBO0921555.1 pectate lyase [Cellulomonas wangleii]MBO0925051.1 pectate lyase [Cellulomonas wangleii]QVI63532.1 pectate lyase [Cellulomonas wangleii]